MPANYTDEQVRKMIIEYTITPDRDTVDRLAKELDKSVKSIIGKLSREGVYKKAIYKTKSGEVPMTKAEILLSLAAMLGIDCQKIIGLEKAPKQDIKYIYEIIKEKQDG